MSCRSPPAILPKSNALFLILAGICHAKRSFPYIVNHSTANSGSCKDRTAFVAALGEGRLAYDLALFGPDASVFRAVFFLNIAIIVKPKNDIRRIRRCAGLLIFDTIHRGNHPIDAARTPVTMSPVICAVALTLPFGMNRTPWLLLVVRFQNHRPDFRSHNPAEYPGLRLRSSGRVLQAWHRTSPSGRR